MKIKLILCDGRPVTACCLSYLCRNTGRHWFLRATRSARIARWYWL